MTDYGIFIKELGVRITALGYGIHKVQVSP